MVNQELAKIFSEIATLLEMEGVAFKPQAYQRAVLHLASLTESVEQIYGSKGLKGLEAIPGIGQSLAKSIEEYLKTGKIKYHQQLKKKTPVDLESLLAIEGLGPKMVKQLYERLKIKNLKELEAAVQMGKIRNLPHFGAKTETNLLQGIAFVKRSRDRFLLGEILPEIQEIVEKLKALPAIEKIDFAGSLRRGKETIGDADLLVVSRNPERVTDFFVKLPGVARVWGQGKTKASIRTTRGYDIDLRIMPARSFGAALQYFTGSKEHNIILRRLAREKGLKLNEYGLFRGKKMVASADEKEVYRALGLNWIEPELRENQGEIEAALRQTQGQANGLPKLIMEKDILGDLHCHSDWNGGRHSIAQMAQAARDRGYQYLGISDHTKFLRIEHGLDEQQLLAQRREIDRLNTRYKIQNTRFRILQGCEANILNDGSLDIKDEVLAELDFVIAGVHSNLKMPRSQMTQRIIKAMKNPNVDIISHPTGRILQKRDEYEVDFEQILKTAREKGTVLEINSSPQRLDLKDANIRRAKEAGVQMVINTDAHAREQMGLMNFGVSQSRRGWAEKEDIINCWPLAKLLQKFQDNSRP